MKPMLGIMAIVLLIVFLAPRESFAQGAFYVEEMKNGRLYVFNDPKQYKLFKDSGELEVRITRIHAGPNGETIYFDSENAIHMYNFKHNLPAEVIIPVEEKKPPLQEKLNYKLGGYMFGDIFYNTSRDPAIATLPNVATPGAEKLNGFQFRRIYFSFDDNLSDDFLTRFRLEADQKALSSDGKISVFVKDAYLQWKSAVGTSDFFFALQKVFLAILPLFSCDHPDFLDSV